jgi:subtilisin family serine protease
MTGRRLSQVLALILLILLFTVNASAAGTIPVVVKLLPGANLNLISSLLGGTVLDSLPGTNTYLLRLPSLPILTPVLKLLGVDWLEADKGIRVPGNPPLSLLNVPASLSPDWYKNQPAYQLIKANSALSYSTGTGVLVADINSSVDYGHPVLAGHLTAGYDFVNGRPTDVAALNDDQSGALFLDDDQSGTLFLDDDQSGTLFLDDQGIQLLDDQSGALFLDNGGGAKSHGTFTVGLIATVAPGATIMPLRAFDDNGNSDLFTLAKAIRYAKQQGATVINMSFGTTTDSKVLKDAIDFAKNANVVLVASAGNNNTSAVQYPAAYSGVLAVAATDLNDRKASFSNFGSYVFVDAPGVHIMSAVPGGRYGIANGTSFSAPIVAGMAALIRSQHPTGVSTTIANSTIPIDWKNPGYWFKLGHGRVDLLDSVH